MAEESKNVFKVFRKKESTLDGEARVFYEMTSLSGTVVTANSGRVCELQHGYMKATKTPKELAEEKEFMRLTLAIGAILGKKNHLAILKYDEKTQTVALHDVDMTDLMNVSV